MRKPLISFLLGILLILFQASFFSRLSPYDPQPNFLLIVLVYLSVGEDLVWPLFWVACMGFFFDILSNGPFGLFCLIFQLLYLTMRGAKKVLLLRRPVFLAVAVMLLHLLQSILLFIILKLLGLPFPKVSSQVNYLLFCSLVGALLSLPLFYLLREIDSPPGLPQMD